MHYWIDGYNFFFRLTKGEGRVKEDEQVLLHVLYEAMTILKMEMTVVFDGKEKNPADPLFRNLKSLRLIYTPFHQTADRYIIEMLECQVKRQQTTVVSSDKVLLKLASLQGSCIQTVEKFVQMVMRKKIKAKLNGHKSSPSLSSQEQERLLKIFEANLQEK